MSSVPAAAPPDADPTSTRGFRVLSRDRGTRARRGRLATAHGTVETPAFMPVGTLGTVKAMAPWELEDLGAEMILGNTYHLALRPGADVIARHGGLHAFGGWRRAILTDSGGFQIFSLNSLCRIDEDGVEFKSHVDGSRHFFRPEDVIALQETLGVDVAMVLDECVAADAPADSVVRAVQRTTRWARRAIDARTRDDQQVFAIVQGGMDTALRERSAADLVPMGFDGYAVGGLSVGERRDLTHSVARHTVELLPEDRPRYLMGVGTPDELVRFVAMGFDMFDCVMPTRNARNGTVFTSRGKLAIRNAEHREDTGPLDPDCSCAACRRFSRSFIRHLFVSGEILAARLLTTHNLHFYLDRMARLRRAIERGTLRAEAADMGVDLGAPPVEASPQGEQR
ncbi:MAG: tRNA guanosine(34) transglycosylase Tgt [Deltaproteobacteria bacterium]|nr:tRNA guanosine(34) transglycosylase Tgt [Deltaproteobacteria bacterium]